MKHELEPVVNVAEKLRASACLVDFAKYNRLSLMLEAFADLIERECHLHMQADAHESAEATQNVAADEGRF